MPVAKTGKVNSRKSAASKTSSPTLNTTETKTSKPVALVHATKAMTDAWKTYQLFVQYSSEFDKAPGKMAMLENLRKTAGTLDDAALSQEVLRAAVWVALIPKQSVALRECARLLALLLCLHSGIESSTLLQGALHIVANRLQDAPWPDECWEKLRCSKPSHTWQELATHCPQLPDSSSTRGDQLVAADTIGQNECSVPSKRKLEDDIADSSKDISRKMQSQKTGSEETLVEDQQKEIMLVQATGDISEAWKNYTVFQQYLKEFDRAPGKMAMLEKLRTTAHTFEAAALSQEVLRVAVWVALVPKQSVALRHCARLLASLLTLPKKLERGPLLQGALHLASLRLQEASTKDELWEQLRRSRPSIEWQELGMKCPRVPCEEVEQPHTTICEANAMERSNDAKTTQRKVEADVCRPDHTIRVTEDKTVVAPVTGGTQLVEKSVKVVLRSATETMTDTWVKNPAFVQYLKEFDRAPGKMAMLENLRTTAGTFDDATLSREILRVAVWVALVPKQSVALRECARLLALLLFLGASLEPSLLLRGALHLVAIRLKESPLKDEFWDKLRCSKQRHEWLELETMCPIPPGEDETLSKPTSDHTIYVASTAVHSDTQASVEEIDTRKWAISGSTYSSRASKRVRKYTKRFRESGDNLQFATDLAIEACNTFEQAGTHARKCHLLLQCAACLLALVDLDVEENVKTKICKAVVFCLKGVDLEDECTLWRDDVWTALESIHTCIRDILPERMPSCKHWRKIATLMPEEYSNEEI